MISRLSLICCCLLFSFSINCQTWQLVTEPFPPYFIAKPNKPGWLHEVIIEALKTQNQNATIEYTHWARALKLAKRHKRVAVLGAFFTEQRAREFSYSQPLATAHTVLFKQAGKDITFTGSLYSLKPYTISKGEDYVVSDEFEHHPELTITTTGSLIESLLLLKHGRVDLVAGTKEVALYWLDKSERLQQAKQTELEIISPYLATQYLHVITKKDHPQAELFQQSLYLGVQSLKNSGKLDEILKSYELSAEEIASIHQLLAKH
ncbi:transporter substrate-binding domain-containing protein [Pseudoalteromonas sp. Hal040]|uniref:transporter substrate-binding domain-containing protein n=1 Tax=unclassified Pseudoalteromonas TaxID=194690 RepID=UPI00301E334C